MNPKGRGQTTISNPKRPGGKNLRVKKEGAAFNYHTSDNTKAKEDEEAGNHL